MWKPVLLLGVFMLAALVVPTHGQCGGILICSTCVFQSGRARCVICQDGFAINVDQTACCSVGCYQDANGYAACYDNQTCLYPGCRIGFLGSKCTPCQSSIQFCDNCHQVSGTSKIECVTCARGYYRTTDATQCCSNEGCNACTGTINADCSGCKSGWFLYQNSCDKCGTTCVSPPNGTARCDPVTGSCYYGCQPNYHGSKCQRLCNLANCNTCTYIEHSDNLTCAVCVAGRYGPYCTSCNSNCLRDTGEICVHNGTCLDGCRPGYRGDKCDVSCDKILGMANCDQCDQYQLTCTVCKPGFWGPQCQFTCGVNCVAVLVGSGPRYCDITDGTCRDGCMPTYYKSDCRGSCPNCANDVCHRTAGTCLDPICDSGFYSATCNQTCPANCDLDRNDLAYCNFTSGDCTYGCRDGYYGEKCTIGCSRFCARSPANTELGPLCNQASGNCVYACEAGFYTPTCSAVCRSTCVDKTCGINSGTCAECDKGVNAGVLCPTGNPACSPRNTWGVLCNKQCPATCGDGTCDRDTGFCNSCANTFWGNTCDQTCLNCFNDTCFQRNGQCIAKCKDGYYGLQCITPCPHSGCLECSRDNESCITCNAGLYGDTCSRLCSEGCAADVTGVTSCNRFTGNCNAGKCKDGFYNLQCTDRCSSFCAGATCSFELGYCAPCDLGWYGQKCDAACSPVSSDENLSTGAIIAISAGSGVVFTLLVVAVSFTVIRSLRKRKSKNPVKHDGQVYLNMTMDATDSASSRMNVHEAHRPSIGCQTNNHVYQDLEPRNGNENDVHKYETVSRP